MRQTPSLSITLPHGSRRPLSTTSKTSSIIGRSRFDLLIALVVSLLTCVAQPARPAAACVVYGDRFSENSFLADFFMHPGATCVEYFTGAARVISGPSAAPVCGTWAWRPDALGFQYTAGNLPCIDWFPVRVQMPDQGVWDFYFTIVVYPYDDPLPQP